MNPTPINKAPKAAMPTKLSLLDIVIARYARQHDRHVSPLVGCYMCLTGVPLSARGLRAAA